MSVQEIAPIPTYLWNIGFQRYNKRFQERQDLNEQAVFRSKGSCSNYRVVKTKKRRSIKTQHSAVMDLCKLCRKTFDFRDVTVFEKLLYKVFSAGTLKRSRKTGVSKFPLFKERLRKASIWWRICVDGWPCRSKKRCAPLGTRMSHVKPSSKNQGHPTRM